MFWAASLSWLTLVGVQASSIAVRGVARLEDGSPAAIGTVLVTELIPQSHAMPLPRIRTRTITDRNGRFTLSIDNVKGDLSIELIDDHCQWRDGYVIVKHHEVATGSELPVEIVAAVDHCAQ